MVNYYLLTSTLIACFFMLHYKKHSPVGYLIISHYVIFMMCFGLPIYGNDWNTLMVWKDVCLLTVVGIAALSDKECKILQVYFLIIICQILFNILLIAGSINEKHFDLAGTVYTLAEAVLFLIGVVSAFNSDWRRKLNRTINAILTNFNKNTAVD